MFLLRGTRGTSPQVKVDLRKPIIISTCTDSAARLRYPVPSKEAASQLISLEKLKHGLSLSFPLPTQSINQSHVHTTCLISSHPLPSKPKFSVPSLVAPLPPDFPSINYHLPGACPKYPDLGQTLSRNRRYWPLPSSLASAIKPRPALYALYTLLSIKSCLELYLRLLL